MRKFRLSIVLLLLPFLTSQQVSYAQDAQTAVVFIDGNLYQIQVTVDNQPRGKTPLTLTLPVGLHTFKFASDGFPERVEKVLVYEGGYNYKVYMEDKAQDASLVSFLIRPKYAMWATDQDRLTFSSPSLYNYDAFNMALTPEKNYPDVVTDPQLIAQLDPTTDIHESPSGRFLSYVARKSSYSLTVLDQQTEQSIEIPVFPMQFSTLESIETLTRVDWSRNEKYGSISRLLSDHPSFLIVEDGDFRRVTVTEFRKADGKQITAYTNYSRPRDDGYVILGGVLEGGREVVRLWLVDLHTLIGEPLPFANGDYWDAEFSEDGNRILVARHRSIDRYNMTTHQVETVSTVLGDLFEHYVVNVKFSDSLRYAYISGLYAPVAWVYRIP